MKKCEKCNMTYSDDHNFCTGCGAPLTTVQTASYARTAYNEPQTPQQKQNPMTALQNAEWFKSWGWLLFLILGLIIEWSFSAILGFAAAGVGFFGAMSFDSAVKKGVAIVLGVIATLLFIITFLFL